MVPITIGKTHRTSGFTLAELLVVIVIVGIMSTIALDTSSRIKEREQINAITINLAGWLNQVRKSALRGSSCSVIVNSSVSPGTTIATAATASTPPAERDANSMCLADNPLTMNTINTAAPQASYKITQSPTGSIIFTPRGSVLLAENSSIDLVVELLPSGPSRCISIKGLIANISISKGETCGNQERF